MNICTLVCRCYEFQIKCDEERNMCNRKYNYIEKLPRRNETKYAKRKHPYFIISIHMNLPLADDSCLLLFFLKFTFTFEYYNTVNSKLL